MSKPKLIAIGAAVQDVFLQGSIFKAHRDHHDGHDMVQEFQLGTKKEIDNVIYSTGGGATNAAVTFARLGLNSGYMGIVGADIAGQAVLDDLHCEGVDTSLVKVSKTSGTGYSTLLLAPNGERTVLTYRGASKHYGFTTKDFNEQIADWFYVSSLSGDIKTLQQVVAYAKHHNIKVAVNPGSGELSHTVEFKALLPDITILSLNKEEMQKLFHGETSEELIRKAAIHVPIAIITDGPHGSTACDRVHIYKAGMYEDIPVFDRTGAGDAFSSGFVAQIAKGQSMVTAITYASANSTAVVSKIGAKAGILHDHARIHQMPIAIKRF
jgi:ribokinase